MTIPRRRLIDRLAAAAPSLGAPVPAFPSGNPASAGPAGRWGEVAVRVGPILAGWSRAGMGPDDLEDAEADLVVECLACWAEDPDRPVDMVVDRARHRVAARRRTELRRAALRATVDVDRLESAAPPDRPMALREVLECLADAVAAGTLSRDGAQAVWAAMSGWGGREAAVAVGCSAVAWRARHSRAVRALAGHGCDREGVA